MNHSPTPKQFRALLRQIRVEAGLHKETLSKRLGKAETFISKCELGERRVQFLEALEICKACGVPMEEFCRRLLKAGADDSAPAKQAKKSDSGTKRIG